MKELIALGLLAVSLTAHAEWIFVADSDDGQSRLLAEAGSLQVGLNTNKVMVIAAKFAVVTGGEMGKPLSVATELASCSAGGGQIVFGEASGNDAKFQWWTKSGGKFYDYAGRLLCAAAERKDSSPQKKSSSEKDV